MWLCMKFCAGQHVHYLTPSRTDGYARTNRGTRHASEKLLITPTYVGGIVCLSGMGESSARGRA